jgi:hypothetical protein
VLSSSAFRKLSAADAGEFASFIVTFQYVVLPPPLFCAAGVMFTRSPACACMSVSDDSRGE